MEELFAILREVRDPRDLNARHDCASMLFIALMATLCGAKSCINIADFAAANEAELSEIVDMPHGPPSHDSFSRLFRLLDPDEMARSFTAFTRALRIALGIGPAKGVVAIDGKRLRHGYERGKSHMPPLMISVWDAETRLSIAARAAPGGSEVKASLAVLQDIDLKKCIVTADALHCYPKMAEAILATGADYALKLKGNNEPLHRSAIEAFAKADAGGKVTFRETTEHGHDRFECRRASVVAVPKGAGLPGLVMFGRIESERQVAGGKASSFVHYVALSRKLSAAMMMDVARMYWGVENHLHLPLDVVFHEDDARTRKDNAPYNLSFIRRMAVDILKSHPDNKSVSRKMNIASWSKEYFYSLFAYMR